MQKRIVLTGATGYLGSHLAESLIMRGYKVAAIKRKMSSLHRIEKIKSSIDMIDADGDDLGAVFKSYGKIDAVIHVATNYGRKGESPVQLVDDNLRFPLGLLKAASDAGVPAFINTDTALNASLNSYSLSKRQFVEWGRLVSKQYKIRFVNLKLEHFYGPEEEDSKFTAYVIKNCLMNVPEIKLTMGEQKRDFIYVDDVVSAFLLIVEKLDQLSEEFVEFDVGSGKAVSIRQLVELIHRLTNSSTRLNFGAYPYREGEAMLMKANTKALRNLGWRLKHSLEQGLRLTIQGYKR